MATNNFKIVFGNEYNEVDVETLIGCLMHTSNIIQEVNTCLKTEKKIEVKIKALETGSFEVHIELVEKLISSLFSNSSVNYAASIVTIVGGIYGLAKFIKGKKPKNIEHNGNDVRITNAYGDVTIIKGDVYNIYNESKNIRDSVSKQFGVLSKNKDITEFSFESQDIDTTIESQDFEAVATKLDIENDQSQAPIIETLQDQPLLIVRPSFTTELKWDFVYNGHKIPAKMDDTEMVKIIDLGEQFAKGDMMLVDLEITKFYDPDLQTHLITKDSYKILKYKQHIQPPRQQKLFD